MAENHISEKYMAENVSFRGLYNLNRLTMVVITGQGGKGWGGDGMRWDGMGWDGMGWDRKWR